MLSSREVLKKVHFLAKSLSHLFRTDGRGKDSEVMEFEGKKLYKLSQSVGFHRSAIFVITDMHPLYQELKQYQSRCGRSLYFFVHKSCEKSQGN